MGVVTPEGVLLVSSQLYPVTPYATPPRYTPGPRPINAAGPHTRSVACPSGVVSVSETSHTVATVHAPNVGTNVGNDVGENVGEDVVPPVTLDVDVSVDVLDVTLDVDVSVDVTLDVDVSVDVAVVSVGTSVGANDGAPVVLYVPSV